MSAIIYQAKLTNVSAKSRPDEWTGGPGVKPPPSFTVSRDRQGATASRYADLRWDLSAYSGHHRPAVLNFSFWPFGTEPSLRQLQLSEEMRWLMFLTMWRNRVPLAPSSLNQRLNGWRILATWADAEHLTLAQILGDATLLRAASQSLPGWTLTPIGTLIGALQKMDPADSGYAVVGSKPLKELRTRASSYIAGQRQTAPIPTRLFSALLANLAREMQAAEALLPSLLRFAAACATDPKFGRVDYDSEWDGVLAPFGLESLWKRCGYVRSRSGIVSALVDLQTLAKLQIHAWSGMRDAEALNLPYDCLTQVTSSGRTFPILKGTSAKLNNGIPKPARWVTAEPGVASVRLAQRIADVIYTHLGLDRKEASNRPLFISANYLPSSYRPLLYQEGDRLAVGDLSFQMGARERWADLLLPVIAAEDLRELDLIDPHRAWEAEEEFSVGRQWPLRSHQFRRSLVLYAQRSGLVSLPSLRRQLQHITEAMTLYYGRNSAYAQAIAGELDEDMSSEWQDGQSESSALAYWRDVLFSDEPTFGGHADFVERKLKAPDGTVLADRQEMMQRFKKGEIAYRITPLGACVKTTACEHAAISLLDVDCVRSNCQNLVGRLSNLNRIIKAQEAMLLRLDPSSVEYRTDRADLEVLLAKRAQILKTTQEVA